MIIGSYRISEHAEKRMAERFGIEPGWQQERWVFQTMRQARTVGCELGKHFDTAPRFVWVADDVAIVTDGPDVITAYSLTPIQRACKVYGLDEEGAA